MRLSIIIMIATILQASAAGFAQKITLSKKNAPLENVLKEIRKQTGYDFFYDAKLIRQSAPVSIVLNDVPLDDALKLLFTGQPFIYSKSEGTIIIYESPKPASQEIIISGRVISADTKQPLPGASVKIKGTTTGTTTIENGFFSIQVQDRNAILVVSYVGYKTKEINVGYDAVLQISLEEQKLALDNVEVTTGYAVLNKDRAAGSFAAVNMRDFDSKVSTDVLSRLEGITSGLAVNRGGGTALSVRGRSTINANDAPLIVVDGFPFQGDVANLNPNDIESITVLKDAAASSIWGVLSGNGVIVIVTRKGRFNQLTSVNFNANTTFGRKPDLFYMPFMSTVDNIAFQRDAYAKGLYTPSIDEGRYAIPPVAQFLEDAKAGRISAAQAEANISALQARDVRTEYSKVFLRPSVMQQYALNVSTGSRTSRSYFSAGFDNSLSAYKGAENNRITLLFDNTTKLAKGLELNALLATSMRRNLDNNVDFETATKNTRTADMYTSFTDDAGNPIAVQTGYSDSFMAMAKSKGLLDWNDYPAKDLNLLDNKTRLFDTRIAFGLKYELLPGINVEARYQLERNTSDYRSLQKQDSYPIRSIINNYTSGDVNNGSLKYGVPLGDWLSLANRKTYSQIGRAQINLNKSWNNNRHQIAGVAGWEIRDAFSEGSSNTLFGYDDNVLTHKPVDFVNPIPTFFGYAQNFNYPTAVFQTRDRFLSTFANAAYTFLNRYTLSASGRIDQSNLFGVRTRDRNVPLWSVGGLWRVDQEPFFHSSWLGMLKLRTSYGYNANIDKSVTAFPTAQIVGPYPSTRLPYARITNPANPLLQWELARQINFGAEWALKNERLSGSVEYYMKKGTHLFGNQTLDPTTGFNSIRANVAGMKGKGVDVQLNSLNLKGAFQWTTQFLFGWNRDKVTDLEVSNTTTAYNLVSNYFSPQVGKPVYGIYSYKWASLDHQGRPQIYGPEGNVTDVGDIYFAKEGAEFSGPANPTLFGGMTNEFSYKGITLTMHINYKFGYKFRRSSINYYNGLVNGGFGHKDYADRWKNPGDEKITNVPAFLVGNPATLTSDYAYNLSNLMVEDGGHIRLQDLGISYNLKQCFRNLPFNSLQVYSFVNNVGILWRANKKGIDPDYVPDNYSMTFPPLRTWSFGVKASF